MAGNHRNERRNDKLIRLFLAVCAVALMLAIGTVGAFVLEERMIVDVENAGCQLTAHISEERNAQVFVDGNWYKQKKIETLLLIGIDDFGMMEGSNAYNNTNQADFMMLFVRDTETGKSVAIHLNRDTITDITLLGVNGDAAGRMHAQLALAYNYGKGQNDSSRNVVEAVSRLLYGIQIDHYITVAMNAVPMMNDWVGGVTVEIMDDMTGANSALVFGEEIKLTGEQALAYVRTRKGLDDSTNINRMKRQRQYIAAWVEGAEEQLKDQTAVRQLILQMSDMHYSDCTAQELAEYAGELGNQDSVSMVDLPGEAVQGEMYMEFYVDETALQRLVLDEFYELVEE